MREVLTLLATKFIFVVYTILIPKFILDISWVEIITCNLAMHLAMGIFIGIVLLPAHITNETEYLLPDREGKIHSDWALHQMLATVDFSANNYFINWISGGLNTHVVHHLFPSINHIHYYRLTKIIRKTALECNIPYRNYSLGKLLVDHLRFLKALAQKNNPTNNSLFDWHRQLSGQLKWYRLSISLGDRCYSKWKWIEWVKSDWGFMWLLHNSWNQS